MARAYTPRELASKKYKQLQWSERYVQAFTRPEATGIWWIGGESQNGKTSFIMDLLKELAELNMGKIMLNALEEGTRLTTKQNIIKYGLESYNGKILIGNETYTDFMTRLGKQRAPWAYIVDSVQMFKMSPAQFQKLREMYLDKYLIIFISHMDGSDAKGRTAKDVRYYADLKLLVEGFRATSAGRYNAGGYLTIWEEGAARYWGEKK